MDGDVLRDDDPVQHPRRTGEERVRAAAAVAGKQHMGWDGDGLGRGFPCGQSVSVPAAGQKLQPRHRLLAVKHLHAVQNLALPAAGIGPQAVDGIGAHRRVGLLQAVAGVGRGQVCGFCRTGFVGGQAGHGHTGFIQHRHLHACQRCRLPRHGRINLDTACWHSKHLLVPRYAGGRGGV